MQPTALHGVAEDRFASTSVAHKPSSFNGAAVASAAARGPSVEPAGALLFRWMRLVPSGRGGGSCAEIVLFVNSPPYPLAPRLLPPIIGSGMRLDRLFHAPGGLLS